MLPIRDDQPRYSTPYLTYFLIGLNILIFLFEWSLSPHGLAVLLNQLGAVPAHLTALLSGSHEYSPTQVLVPFFTSMFLHFDWTHVIGNMWFLYIFGDNVEDYLGHFSYLVFYLMAGLIAMATQALAYPHATGPTVGASGAIAGVLGAYFVLYPRARVLTWVFVIVIYLPAWVMLGYWFAYQFLTGTATSLVYEGRAVEGVAVWAHVGGFIAGAVMIKIFPQRPRRYPYAIR